MTEETREKGSQFVAMLIRLTTQAYKQKPKAAYNTATILTLRRQGHTYVDIGKEVGMSEKVVRTICRKAKALESAATETRAQSSR